MTSLILSGVLFAPGNMLIFAMMLMFCVGIRKIPLNISQKLFCYFVGFSSLGCVFGSSPFNSFEGNLLRCEGLVFWIIACRLAYMYWATREDDQWGVEAIGVCAVLSSAAYIFLLVCGVREPANPLAAGAFGAISFSAMVTINPIMSVFPLFAALCSGCRTSMIIVASSIFLYAIVSGVKSRYIAAILVFCAIIVSSAGMFGQMSVVEKLRSFRLSGVGDGTRIHFIKETARIWKEYPTHKKLIGDGYDSIVKHLKNPPTGSYRATRTPDRTHNIFCDILLQTGFIGLILFVASLFMAVVSVYLNPTAWNKAMLMGLSAWVVFGLFNPQGQSAHCVAMICLFGIRSANDEV